MSDLEPLTGDTYSVFWLDKTSVENKTDIIEKVAPALTKVDAAPATLK